MTRVYMSNVEKMRLMTAVAAAVGLCWLVVVKGTSAAGEPAAKVIPGQAIYARKSPMTLNLLDKLLTARKQDDNAAVDYLSRNGLNAQEKTVLASSNLSEGVNFDYVEPITYHPTFIEDVSQKPTEKPVISMKIENDSITRDPKKITSESNKSNKHEQNLNQAQPVLSTTGHKNHHKAHHGESYSKSVLRISAYNDKLPTAQEEERLMFKIQPATTTKTTTTTTTKPETIYGKPLDTADRRESSGSKGYWRQKDQTWGQGGSEQFRSHENFGPRYQTNQKDNDDEGSYWRLEIDTNPRPVHRYKPKSTYRSGDGWKPVASSAESISHVISHSEPKPAADSKNNYNNNGHVAAKTYTPADNNQQAHQQKPLEETYFSQATDYANAEFSSKLAAFVDKHQIKLGEEAEEQVQPTSNDEEPVPTQDEMTGSQSTSLNVYGKHPEEASVEVTTKKIDAFVAIMSTDNSASEAYPGLSSLSEFISKAVNDAISKQFEAQKAGTDASRKTTEAAAEITKQHQRQAGGGFKSDDATGAAPSGKRRRRPRPYRRHRRRKNQQHQQRKRRPVDYDTYYDEGDYYYDDSSATGKGSEEKAPKKEEPPPVELFAGPLPADKQGEGDNPLGFASVKVNPNFNHHMQAPVVISQKTLQLGRRDDDDDDDDVKPTAYGMNPKKGPFGALGGLNSHFGGSLGGIFGGPGGKALAKSQQNPLLQQAKAREAAYNPLASLKNYKGVSDTPQLSQLNEDSIGGGGVVSKYNTNSDEDVFDDLAGMSNDDLDGLIELLASYRQGGKGNLATAGPTHVAQTGIGADPQARPPPPPPPPPPAPTTAPTTTTTTTTTAKPAPIINIITPDALFPHLFESGKLDYSKLSGLTEYLGQNNHKKRNHQQPNAHQLASLYNKKRPSRTTGHHHRSQLRQKTSPLAKSKVTLTAGELQRALALATVGGKLRSAPHSQLVAPIPAKLPYAALPARLPTTPSSPPTTLQQLLDAQRLRYYPHNFNNVAGRKIIPLARHPSHPGQTFGLPPVIQVPRRKKTTKDRALDALPPGDRELLAEALYEQYRKVQAKNSYGDLEAEQQDQVFGQFDDAFGQFYGLKRRKRRNAASEIDISSETKE